MNTYPAKLKSQLSLLVVSIALSACGGGSSGGGASVTVEETPAPAPTSEELPGIATNAIATRLTAMGLTLTVGGTPTVTLQRSARSNHYGQGDDTDESDSDDSSDDADAAEQASESSLLGRTLYTFDVDDNGVSNCVSEECTVAWPPLGAPVNTTANPPLSLIEREDGSLQWALRGRPLYLFSGDSAPGDVNGEGLNGVWHTARMAPTVLSGATDDGSYWTASGSVLVTSAAQSGQSDDVSQAVLDRQGFSLYTFDLDQPGVSSCQGPCLEAWPALLAFENDQASAPFSIIERSLDTDGTPVRQWAYQGRPLYFFANDVVPGDTNGKDLPNWRMARPLPWFAADSARGTIFQAAGAALSAEPDEQGVEQTGPQPRHGFALYTFDADDPGVSNCSDGCLNAWPALMAHPRAQAAGPFTLITRDSGELQWAVNDKPLYFFAGDEQPGDINGDEVNGVWHLARPLPVGVSTHSTEGQLFAGMTGLLAKDGSIDDSLAGFTLYTFDADVDGVSTCFGGCEATWPPLFAAESAQDFGDFTVTDRDDPDSTDDDTLHLKQWAYKGQPLYFFAGDSTPGETNGVYGQWHIARP